jgi:nucleotide-binding universal stress UspA family protein
MKTIKHITVATDFSVTSRNAYRYAKQLAKNLQAVLTVLHVQEHLIMVSDVMIVPLPSENDEEVVKNMEQFLAEENTTNDSSVLEQNVIMKIVAGNPVDILVGLSESDNTDLIVMGTTGLSDVLTKVFGATSQKVSNKAHCPVVLVPRDAKWQSIEQILFASNYDSMTTESVNEMVDFAMPIKANIHFVNVRNYDPVFEVKQKEIDWNLLFTKIDSTTSSEKHTIYGNDVIQELNLYVEENKIDLMVFVSKHRNFFENLTHKSITEKMALSGLVPMMVMHLNDKGNNVR